MGLSSVLIIRREEGNVRRGLAGLFLVVSVVGFLTTDAVCGSYPLPGQQPESIVLFIQNPVQGPPVPGGVFDFLGTIGNFTGADFNIANLTFNFFNYDPTKISSFNPLPNGDNFIIANGTTSPVVTLFDLTLSGSVSPNGIYSADVVVSDPFGNFSNDVTVIIAPIPEPATIGLVAWALACLVLALSCRVTHRKGAIP